MQLSKNFSSAEFECGCGCGFGSAPGDVSDSLLSLVQSIRDTVRRPVILSSGCRCPFHNRVVDGSKKSAHMKGEAGDIKIANSSERFSIVKAAIKLDCVRIEPRDTWVHVDVSRDLPQDVMW